MKQDTNSTNQSGTMNTTAARERLERLELWVSGLIVGTETNDELLSHFPNGISGTDQPFTRQTMELHEETYAKMIEERLAADPRTFPPNPWVGLPIADFQDPGQQQEHWQQSGQNAQAFYKVDNPHFTGPFRLRDVPRDIFLDIIDLLPPESAAALALTNKEYNTLLGDKVRNLKVRNLGRKSAETFALLQLLERDSASLTVACPGCDTLHHPLFSGPGCEKGCPGSNAARFRNPQVRRNLVQFKRMPSTLNYNLIRAIAIQRSRGAQGAETCGELMGKLSETEVIQDEYCKTICTSRAFFDDDGDLVLKNRISLALHGDFDFITRKALSYFDDFIEFQSRHGRAPCGDLRWFEDFHHDEVAQLVYLSRERPVDEGFAKELLSPDCYDILVSHENVTLKRQCRFCPTACCMQAADVPGIGRVVTLTAWKSLGGGQNKQDQCPNRWKYFSAR